MERIGSASGIVSVLEPGQSDADKAAAYRNELKPLLDQVCAIFNRGRAEGLIINFSIAGDQYGRSKVMAIDIVKPL